MVDPLSVTASIIAVLQLSSKVLGYLNDVQHASSDRLKCEIEITNLYSLLVSLRSRLQQGGFEKPWYDAVRALSVERGLLDQFKDALQELQTRMTNGFKLGKMGQALVWKFNKEEIASILGRMERLKGTVEIALQMDHFKLSQAIKNNIDVVLSQGADVKAMVEKTLQYEDLAKHRRILQWISTTDYPTQHSDIIERRQAGTGQWVLSAPEMTQWLGQVGGTLFCPGIPGAGKTIVAAIAIEHLLILARNTSVGLAYAYCNYKAQEKQDTYSILAALLKQLAQTRPEVAGPVQRLYYKHSTRGTRPSVKEISGALQELLKSYSSVYVVIDALDELGQDHRDQFLSELRNLQTVHDVRLMATSRKLPEIVTQFDTALQLEVHAHEEDVKCFVTSQIGRLPRCIQNDSDLQARILDTIAAAVGSMFLLANLYIQSFLDKRRAKEVKATLTQLSQGSSSPKATLDKAYGVALERIKCQPAGDRELAIKVLLWITYAKRALTTTELCHALAVEPDTTELDQENILSVDDLVSVCAGLVIVDNESGVMRLVHYTAQEYFEQSSDILQETAELEITSACLTYISFHMIEEGDDFDMPNFDFYEYAHEQYGLYFYEYAARHWGKHAQTVQNKISGQIITFLSCTDQVKWAAKDVLYRRYSHLVDTTGLHLAAYFNLGDILKIMVLNHEQGKNVALSQKDALGHTLLYIAAENGHQDIAAFLLGIGAEAYALNEEQDTPLMLASSRGDGDMVQLLLSHGAEINTQGEFQRSALWNAAWRGHNHIVGLLLDNGADINSVCEYYGTPLKAATLNGHENIIKSLLDKGADANIVGGVHGSPLQAAASIGHENIVKFLCDNGANVNIVGGDYESPLQAAALSGHENIVKFLLDEGADANIVGGEYGSPLQLAALIGHEKIIRFLLDNGAHVNVVGGVHGLIHGSPLHAAVYMGGKDTVKILLDNGADVNVTDKEHSTPLHLAVDSMQKDTVKLLLDSGAEVDAFSKDYGTPLQLAVKMEFEEIALILLDSGADINAEGSSYGNALHIAAWDGKEGMVRLLVRRGADVNKKGGEHGSALLAARKEGHEGVVQILLDAGAVDESEEEGNGAEEEEEESDRDRDSDSGIDSESNREGEIVEGE